MTDDLRYRRRASRRSRKDVYSELIEYVARAKGHDRQPKIVQDPDRRFRRNLSADDRPAPATPLPARPAATNSDTIAEQLRTTAAGDDPRQDAIVIRSRTTG